MGSVLQISLNLVESSKPLFLRLQCQIYWGQKETQHEIDSQFQNNKLDIFLLFSPHESLVIDHDMTHDFGFQKSSDMAAVFSAFCGACPELNADFECPSPKIEICHKNQHGFRNTETLTSTVVFLYVYHIMYISCWRYLTFYVSCCRDESRKLSETNYCIFHHNLRKGSILEMLRLFLCSVYYYLHHNNDTKLTLTYAQMCLRLFT